MRFYKSPIFVTGFLILMTSTALQVFGKLSAEYVTVVSLVMTAMAGHDWATTRKP